MCAAVASGRRRAFYTLIPGPQRPGPDADPRLPTLPQLEQMAESAMARIRRGDRLPVSADHMADRPVGCLDNVWLTSDKRLMCSVLFDEDTASGKAGLAMADSRLYTGISGEWYKAKGPKGRSLDMHLRGASITAVPSVIGADMVGWPAAPSALQALDQVAYKAKTPAPPPATPDSFHLRPTVMAHMDVVEPSVGSGGGIPPGEAPNVAAMDIAPSASVPAPVAPPARMLTPGQPLEPFVLHQPAMADPARQAKEGVFVTHDEMTAMEEMLNQIKEERARNARLEEGLRAVEQRERDKSLAEIVNHIVQVNASLKNEVFEAVRKQYLSRPDGHRVDIGNPDELRQKPLADLQLIQASMDAVQAAHVASMQAAAAEQARMQEEQIRAAAAKAHADEEAARRRWVQIQQERMNIQDAVERTKQSARTLGFAELNQAASSLGRAVADATSSRAHLAPAPAPAPAPASYLTADAAAMEVDPRSSVGRSDIVTSRGTGGGGGGAAGAASVRYGPYAPATPSSRELFGAHPPICGAAIADRARLMHEITQPVTAPIMPASVDGTPNPSLMELVTASLWDIDALGMSGVIRRVITEGH